MNRTVKIPSRRLYSLSLKDVPWLERALLIFLISHTFVCKFGRGEGAEREKNCRQMYEKLEKLTERLLSNLLLSILTLNLNLRKIQVICHQIPIQTV